VTCALAQAAGGPSLPAPLYRTVAVAAAGTVYVLGGHNLPGGSVTSVESFDPRSRTTRVAGNLVYPTHGAAAANLRGRILVFGGASSSVHGVVQQFFPASEAAA
jgi:N-acetylneuraminic acid mutarotase